MFVLPGSTNISTYWKLKNTDGTPATGLTITDFDLQYVRAGAAPSAKVDATALAATDTAHTDNYGIAIDATDQPGLYRFDFPDAAFAAGVIGVTLTVKHTSLAGGSEDMYVDLALLNRLLAYVQLLARTDAAIATDRTTQLGEINANQGTGAGSFDNTAAPTVALTSAYDLYHADIQLHIDEANTQDEWTVTAFKNGVRLTSGVTSPTIQVVKRADGTDLVAATALTEIGTTESFKKDCVTTERTTAGEAVVAIFSATIDGGTRTFSRVVGRDSTA